MPLVRYFSFVGGVLFALLFILDACFPELPALAKAKVYPPVIRIYSDRKWPDRIVYDTTLPTIVPMSIASIGAITEPPDIIAETSAHSKERAAFAMLTTAGEKSQTSNTKMQELKPRQQIKIVRKRPPAPRFAMARHPQFGWFGRNFW